MSLFIRSLIPSLLSKPHLPAHDEIAHLWGEGKKQLTSPSCAAFESLGLYSEDRKAQQELFPIFEKAFRGELTWTPSSADSGIYFGKNSADNKLYAVFKVGRMRAVHESSMRRLACLLRVEERVVPGVFAALQSPKWDPNEEMVESLWNGRVKVYKPLKSAESDKASFVVGILEPYLEKAQSATMAEYLDLIIAAVVFGLRDGKPDGIRSRARLVDFEDVMAARIGMPEQNLEKQCASLHLPLLDHPLTSQPISQEDLCALQDKAKRWDLSQTENMLGGVKKQFADSNSEAASVGKLLFDEGNCEVEIEEQAPHPLGEKIQSGDCAFSSDQIAACIARIQSLQQILHSPPPQLRPIDLVFAVDSLYCAHYKGVEMLAKNPAVDPKVKRVWNDFSPAKIFWNIGLYSPATSGIPITACSE